MREFLFRLQLKVAIRAPDATELDRVAQLTQRTTQFNLNGARRSATEVRRLLDAGSEVTVIEAKDRFGDYGLVGALLVHGEPPELVVESFLLSCRILGKGVEDAILMALRSRYEGSRIRRLLARFIPTERNTPFRQFLGRTGWVVRSKDAYGADYELALENISPHCDHIDVTLGEKLYRGGVGKAGEPSKQEGATAPAGGGAARIHHVGIAVPSLTDSIALYRRLRFRCGEVIHDPVQNVELAMCRGRAPEGIELIGAVDETSPCHRMVTVNGGGPYHLGLEVEDTEEFLRRLDRQGSAFARVGNRAKAVLFDGREVCFVNVDGVGLIELIDGEPGRAGDEAADANGMMVVRLVSDDADNARAFFRLIGYETERTADDDQRGLEIVRLARVGCAGIEVVVPRDSHSPEHEYLEKNGPCAYEVLHGVGDDATGWFEAVEDDWADLDQRSRYGTLEHAAAAKQLSGAGHTILFRNKAAEWKGDDEPWDVGDVNRENLTHKEYLTALENCTASRLLRLPIHQTRMRNRFSTGRYAPPRTATERRMVELWATVLGVDRVGRDDDFFELGGHSLKAVQVVTRIRREFGVELPLATFFEAPTVAGVSECIDGIHLLRQGSAKPAPGRGEDVETIEL